MITAKIFINNIKIILENNIKKSIAYDGEIYKFIDLTDTNNIFLISSSKFKTFYILDEKKFSPDSYYDNNLFYTESGMLYTCIDGLPNNIFEWDEEEYLYYELKYC